VGFAWMSELARVGEREEGETDDQEFIVTLEKVPLVGWDTSISHDYVWD
jgi:hypothetical protein